MPDRLLDLHLHTPRSDGLNTPAQWASLARRSGLAGIAITDHDVLPDRADLEWAAASFGIAMLGGIELSVRLGPRGLHVLGYGFDPENPALAALCAELQAGRRARFRGFAERLLKRGLRLDERRLAQLEANHAPGRVHLARELVRAKHAGNVRDAFRKHLGEFDGLAPGASVPEAAAALAALHGAGGVAALAHPPADLKRADWRALADAGLDGIEANAVGCPKNHAAFLAERVAEYGFVPVGGSDAHGEPPRFVGARTTSWETWEALLARARPRA